MAIQTNATTGMNIDFGSSPAVFGLSAMSILIHVIQTVSTSNSYRMLEIVNPAAVNTNERYLVQLNATNDAKNFSYFRTSTVNTGGEWRSNSNTIPLSTLKHIGITHDMSSINNDPVFYADGVAVTANEINAPSGAWRTTGATNCYLGGRSTVASPYGTLFGVLIYNRVFSAAEMLSAALSKKFIPSYSGLVFAPNLNGPAGGIADGATMAAGNTIRDLVSGATGTPAGSPVFKHNTILSLGGE